MKFSLPILALAAFLSALPAAAEDLTGRARAVDGETLRLGDVTVRLFGIDALELQQTCTTRKGKPQQCGDLSRQMLDTLTHNVKVKCQTKGEDPDGTVVAVCYAGPFDINEQMVAAGWAFPLLVETDAYVRAETFARARHEGVWRGNFIPPAQWRRENGLQ